MKTPSNRLTSLDAFRGFTIILMILVNNPGSWSYVLPPLRHAEWHGCTPTDLVFPFFLFIMGTAMAFSLSKRIQVVQSRWPVYWKVIRRSAILVGLGWFLSLYPKFDFATMRIPGVLFRLGVCYFFASMIILHLKKNGQIVALLTLLFGYWGLMTLIPFSGQGKDPWIFGGNFAQYIDNLLLQGHMWKKDYDPEGLISTLPAIATVLFGYFAGVWLHSDRQPLEKTNSLFIAGTIAIIVTLFWQEWMPLNKALWTSSYSVYTAGLAMLCLALSYWWLDIKGNQKGTKIFVVFGMNPIFAFVGSSFLAKNLYWWKFTLSDGSQVSLKGLFYNDLITPIFGDWLGSLLYAFLNIVLWWGILSWMYRRKIFIKI